MTDFRLPNGFEDALRPPVDIRRARLAPSVLRAPSAAVRAEARARLARLAARAPEVMVKITGGTRDCGHLLRHLDYISRNGKLALEGPDGERLEGRAANRTLAEDWFEEASILPGRRDAPLSRSIVLSMPMGVEAFRVEDAARAFARDVFGDRFSYVFALHDEGRHPHVHLTVRALGRDGERLNPRKADLQVWREAFARALRDRGVEAEATPRRARGVVRKGERTAVRKGRERFVAGKGEAPRVIASAVRDALEGGTSPGAWDRAIRDRQMRVRRALVAEALRLARSDRGEDQALGRAIELFVREMPLVRTQRDAIRDQAPTHRADREIRAPDGRSRGRPR